MIKESFETTKPPLNDVLKDIKEGDIQLPDFQRSWVWDDERIKGLLASIAMSYPIGAIMLLETGNEDVRFKPRPIEGAQANGDPELFILDGQQRLTALFQTLYTDKVVETRDTKQKPIKRWYYFDIIQALADNYDIEDAIFSVREDKKITEDFDRRVLKSYENDEDEFEDMVFPTNKLLKSDEWFNKYMNYWEYSPEKIKVFQAFSSKVIKRFEHYQLPVIKLFKHNPKEAVCQVFEKVNTGGVSLNVFELLTATFAADDFNLREDWNKRRKEFEKIPVISGIDTNELLQAITLYTTIDRKEKARKTGCSADNLPAVSCKKRDVLKLTLGEYQRWVDTATESFINVGKLLNKNKVFKSRDVPYTSQLVPLSVIIGQLGVKAETEGAKTKILRWYWNGIFGELYGGANETRFAKDVIDVVDWVNGASEEPTSVRDAFFAEDRLWTLKTRNSAAYKGVYILVMREGAKDFRTGDEIEWSNYFDEGIDIHHIFPQKWCEDNGINQNEFNSIINKTPLSPRTNRMIGGRAPSLYIETIAKDAQMTMERIESIMNSHLILIEHLKNDDFKGFLESRKELLLQAIERATGKKVQRTETTE